MPVLPQTRKGVSAAGCTCSSRQDSWVGSGYRAEWGGQEGDIGVGRGWLTEP